MSRILYLICLFLGFATSAPTKDHPVVIDKDFYAKGHVILEVEHEIVNMLMPFNEINGGGVLDKSKQSMDVEDIINHPTLLFVQADIDETGKKTERGMYILKKGNVTKLLNNGRDATSGDMDTKIAFIGAEDGIYKYDDNDESITKYGTFNAPVKGIAKSGAEDLIYALTDFNSVYKVTKEGTNKKKIEVIENAVEIVLDYTHNLYYYTKDNKVNVYNESKGVTAVTGLPETNINFMKLIRPKVEFYDRTFIIINNNMYTVFANGTSKLTENVVKERPSAISIEFPVIQFYAYNKKIYEYPLYFILLVDFVPLPEPLEKILKPLKEVHMMTENNGL